MAGNFDLSELNASLRMNRRKSVDNQGVNDFDNEVVENFRTTQSQSEFLFAIDQMRLPNGGYSVDREVDTPASASLSSSTNRKSSRKVGRDTLTGMEDSSSRRSFFNTSLSEREVESREHRGAREVRKQATPKFTNKSSHATSRSGSKSYQGNEIFGLISQAGQSSRQDELKMEDMGSNGRNTDASNGMNGDQDGDIDKYREKQIDIDNDYENDPPSGQTEYLESPVSDLIEAYARSKETKKEREKEKEKESPTVSLEYALEGVMKRSSTAPLISKVRKNSKQLAENEEKLMLLRESANAREKEKEKEREKDKEKLRSVSERSSATSSSANSLINSPYQAVSRSAQLR